MDCFICARAHLSNVRENPSLVWPLNSGFWVLGDNQFYRGYSILLAKEHVESLHEYQYAPEFMADMLVIGVKLAKKLHPVRINYEILMNREHHLHAHIIPRYDTDPYPLEPVWNHQEEYFKNSEYNATELEIKKLRGEVR